MPIGAFLSGGVDSPLICKYVKNYLFSDFSTFSIGSNSKTHDETYKSNQYAKALNTRHHIEKMTAENSLDYLDEILIKAGEPIGDSSIVPAWKLSNAASSKVTVILSGDGADELFLDMKDFNLLQKTTGFGIIHIILDIL